LPMCVPTCGQRLSVDWDKYESGTKVNMCGCGLCDPKARWRPYSDGTLRPRQNEHLMLGASGKLTNNHGDALVFREVLDAARQAAAEAAAASRDRSLATVTLTEEEEPGPEMGARYRVVRNLRLGRAAHWARLLVVGAMVQ